METFVNRTAVRDDVRKKVPRPPPFHPKTYMYQLSRGQQASLAGLAKSQEWTVWPPLASSVADVTPARNLVSVSMQARHATPVYLA